jgi:hypothetical protein
MTAPTLPRGTRASQEGDDVEKPDKRMGDAENAVNTAQYVKTLI